MRQTERYASILMLAWIVASVFYVIKTLWKFAERSDHWHLTMFLYKNFSP